jgi:hypothetical protein
MRKRKPLIFQNDSAGVGTATAALAQFTWLPRFHRAGPSTSLDKSYTIQLTVDYSREKKRCQKLMADVEGVGASGHGRRCFAPDSLAGFISRWTFQFYVLQ